MPNYPEPILDKIVDHLINREHTKPKGHYPSSAYKCVRQQWYSWKEIPITNPISAAGMLRIQYGISIHEGFIKIMKDMGFDMLDEMNGQVHVPGLEYDIRYRVDLLLATKDSGMMGGEVKSTYGRGVVELQEKGEPREHDLPQVVTYAYCTKILWWYLIYLGRDTAYYTEFLLHYSLDQDTLTTYQVKNGEMLHSTQHDNMMKDVINRFKWTETAIKDNMPPEREFKLAVKNGEAKTKFQNNKVEYRSSWQCQYCGWQSECYKSTLGHEGMWYGEERIG